MSVEEAVTDGGVPSGHGAVAVVGAERSGNLKIIERMVLAPFLHDTSFAGL